MDQESYLGQLPPKLWGRATSLLGLLRDVIRIGQYEVGEPLLWSASIDVPVSQTLELTANVPADGMVNAFRWAVENTTADADVDGYVDSIALGAQTLYRNVSGQVVTAAGDAGPLGGFGMPFVAQGFLRRFPAYQNSSFLMRCVNLDADNVHRFSLYVEQYAIPSWVARRLREGFLG